MWAQVLEAVNEDPGKLQVLLSLRSLFSLKLFFWLHLWRGDRHHMSIRGIGICIVWPLTRFAVMSRLTLDVFGYGRNGGRFFF